MQIKKILTNNLYCKLFFVLIPFLNEIPLLMAYVNPLMKFGILMCAVYLLADILTERQTLWMPFITAAVIFLFAGLISCVLNIRATQRSMNIISFLYNFCTLIVLFPVSKNKSEQQIQREFELINLLLLVMTTICASIGLYLFFSKTQIKLEYNDYVYRMGHNDGRLVGLMRNAIYPTHAIGIFCGIVQLSINALKDRRNKLIAAVVVFSVVINLIALVLQQSKGLNIGMFVAVFFITLAIVYRHKFRSKMLQNPSALARTTVAASSATAAFGLFYALEQGIFWLSKRIMALIAIAKRPTRPNVNSPALNQIIQGAVDFVGRNEVSGKYGAMTGRPYVWKSGLSWFLKKPIFGYGSHTLANDVKPYEGSKEQLTHFHNIFVQALVSYGIIGFIGLLLMVIQCAARILRKIFTADLDEKLGVLISASGLIVFLFVINMADTTILFMMKHSGFVFFIYLGYVIHWCGGKDSVLDKPFRLLADWLDRKVHHAK